MASDGEATLLLRIKQLGQEALDKVVFTFGDLVGIAKAVGNAMAAPIKAFEESERASNLLNQQLVNQGLYAAKLAQSYEAMASKLQKTTLFEDESITKSQAAVQAFLGRIPVTEKLTASILDFAQAQGMDATAAAQLVGKAIGSSTNALARYGIEVDTTKTKEERLAQVVDGLSAKFGGQAEAAGRGLGAMTQFKNTLDDLYETVGKELAPAIVAITKYLAALVTQFQENAGSVSVFAQALVGLVKTADFIGLVFMKLANTIGLIGTAAGAVTEILKGHFSAAGQVMKAGYESMLAENEKLQSDHNARMNTLGQTFTQQRSAQVAAQEQMEVQAAKRKGAVIAQEEAALNANRLAQQNAALQQQNALIGQSDAQVLAKKIEHLGQLAQAETDANAQALLLKQQHDLLMQEQQMLTDQTNFENQMIQEQMVAAQNLLHLQTMYAQDEQNKSAMIAAEQAYNSKMLSLAKSREQQLQATKRASDLALQAENQRHKTAVEQREQQHRQAILTTFSSLNNSLLTASRQGARSLFGVWKAAATAEAIVSAYQAAAKALASAPWPANFVAAAAALAAGFVNVRAIQATNMAQGGIVQPRNGGTIARIGEAGASEAVIPLTDEFLGKLGGNNGNVTINFQGPIMGDAMQAREFAEAIDRELFRLRKDGGSIAFDGWVK